MTQVDDAGSPNPDWIQQWIEQQRVLLRERDAQQRAQGVSEALRQQLLELGARWLDVGQAYLTGLQQVADGVPGAQAAGAFKLGEEFMNSWRGPWNSLADSWWGQSPPKDKPAAPDAADVWSDVLRQIPPLGMAREHNATLRELAQAHAECQRLEQALRVMLFGVQAEALELLERRVREHHAKQGQAEHEAADPTSPGPTSLGFRELYDLWVECGEQVYAQVAHSEAYCRLQAQLGNATMQLRARQQKLIEHALKQFDLPTRAELNSVHRQLREQARTLRELQAQLEKSRGTGSARPRSKGKTV